MPVDNSTVLRQFVPETWDGDTYVYTEMLDRRKTKGNNGFRLVKAFYHRSQEEFDNQLPAIRKLCDSYGARAYFRPSPRSYKKTAGTFLTFVTEAYIAGNYDGMKSFYTKACANTAPNVKYWMFDVDDMEACKYLAKIDSHTEIIAQVPSKTGMHWIVKPFRLDTFNCPSGMEIKKDANTNLYIPDNAE